MLDRLVGDGRDGGGAAGQTRPGRLLRLALQLVELVEQDALDLRDPRLFHVPRRRLEHPHLVSSFMRKKTDVNTQVLKNESNFTHPGATIQIYARHCPCHCAPSP